MGRTKTRVLAAGLAWSLGGCSPAPPQTPPAATATAIATANHLAEGMKALNQQDFDRAATLLAGVLETQPDSRATLLAYVKATQHQAIKAPEDARWAIFRKSAAAASKLRHLHRLLTAEEAAFVIQALYNDACTLAMTGHPDQAMAALGEAVDAGMDRTTLLDNDTDLETIRDRPEFARLKHDAGLHGAARGLARNRPFAFAFRLPDADGKPVSTDDLKGKVVVVNFWAPWSPPCRRESPFLAVLDQKYRDNGLEIVGLSDERDRDKLAPFLAEFPAPYRLLQADEAAKKQLPRWNGYPTTLLLDRKGRVRLLVEGFGPADGALIEQAVTILLGEK